MDEEEYSVQEGSSVEPVSVEEKNERPKIKFVSYVTNENSTSSSNEYSISKMASDLLDRADQSVLTTESELEKLRNDAGKNKGPNFGKSQNTSNRVSRVSAANAYTSMLANADTLNNMTDVDNRRQLIKQGLTNRASIRQSLISGTPGPELQSRRDLLVAEEQSELKNKGKDASTVYSADDMGVRRDLKHYYKDGAMSLQSSILSGAAMEQREQQMRVARKYLSLRESSISTTQYKKSPFFTGSLKEKFDCETNFEEDDNIDYVEPENELKVPLLPPNSEDSRDDKHYVDQHKALDYLDQIRPRFDDDLKDMTRGRKIARRLSKYAWYYPMKAKYESSDSENQKRIGCLDDGWAYFEHVNLARYFKPTPEQEEENKANKVVVYDKAEPGEADRPTLMYPVSTPESQLGDFGIAVGTYFNTIRWLAIITFIGGLLCLPNTLYYMSEEYSTGKEDLGLFLKGSAICNMTRWVPCPNCTMEEYTDAPSRYALGVIDDKTLTFALRNECSGATKNCGITNLVTVLFLYVALTVMTNKQEKTEVAFDEDMQTASDYSILVNGAPEEADDPHEWKEFFEKISGDHVTFVTVAIQNNMFLRALADRRFSRQKLQKLLGMKYTYDEDELFKALDNHEPYGCFKWFLSKLGLVQEDPHQVYQQIQDAVERIRMWANKEDYFETTDVFVTFETEAGQRKTLQELTVGSLAIESQVHLTFPNEKKFRGKYILDVTEPDEPSTIRWLDLATKEWKRKVGLLISTTLTLIAIYVAANVIISQKSRGGQFVATLIAIMNTIVPIVCKKVVDFEIHPDAGDKSLSLYFKITIFRWVNTAIILMLASPFANTLGGTPVDLLPSIYAVFFAELVTAPGLALIDPFGHYQRHFVAPRAETQDEINANFNGTPYELAERYTTITKLLFLCFFYAVLYPMGFFVCSFALGVTYYVDKFCLMRVWQKAPSMGNEIASFSRDWFYPITLVALSIFSAYQFSGFPYDDLCDTNQLVNDDYVGTFEIYKGGKVNEEFFKEVVTIGVNETFKKYCSQDLPDRHVFPPHSQEGVDQWMSDDQKFVVNIIGWSGFGLMAGILSLRLVIYVMNYIKVLWYGDYQPSGKDMGINFSQCESIAAYIPEIHRLETSFPLLACNLDTFDNDYIGWQDPTRPYEYHTLWREMPLDVREIHKTRPLMSMVRHYPPPTAER